MTKIGQNWAKKYLKMPENWLNLVKIGQNWPKLVKIRTEMQGNAQKWTKTGQKRIQIVD